MEQVSRETKGKGSNHRRKALAEGGVLPHPDRTKEAPDGQWSLSVLSVGRRGQLPGRSRGKARLGVFEEKGGEWSIREGAWNGGQVRMGHRENSSGHQGLVG